MKFENQRSNLALAFAKQGSLVVKRPTVGTIHIRIPTSSLTNNVDQGQII